MSVPETMQCVLMVTYFPYKPLVVLMSFFRFGGTPLMLAALNGHAYTVAALLHHGAGTTLEARDHRFGRTALLWAAASGTPETVEVLVAAGANVNAQSAR
jgi:ankyrin repeat protein